MTISKPNEFYLPDCAFQVETQSEDPFDCVILCTKGACTNRDRVETLRCVGIQNCDSYVPMDGCSDNLNVDPETLSEKFDPVSHPSHYTEGRTYEPKDVIRDWDLNFNLGSALKYISRAGRKDDILQDLKKARQFLDFEIEYLEKTRKEKK